MFRINFSSGTSKTMFASTRPCIPSSSMGSPCLYIYIANDQRGALLWENDRGVNRLNRKRANSLEIWNYFYKRRKDTVCILLVWKGCEQEGRKRTEKGGKNRERLHEEKKDTYRGVGR